MNKKQFIYLVGGTCLMLLMTISALAQFVGPPPSPYDYPNKNGFFVTPIQPHKYILPILSIFTPPPIKTVPLQPIIKVAKTKIPKVPDEVMRAVIKRLEDQILNLYDKGDEIMVFAEILSSDEQRLKDIRDAINALGNDAQKLAYKIRLDRCLLEMKSQIDFCKSIKDRLSDAVEECMIYEKSKDYGKLLLCLMKQQAIAGMFWQCNKRVEIPLMCIENIEKDLKQGSFSWVK